MSKSEKRMDVLNREEFVEKLFELTQQISNNKKSTSFAIDGSWGVGKSFVLDMYDERLSIEQSEETNHERYFVIRYNCWKYDYYEEPLIAIVSVIIETIEQKTQLFPNSEKKDKILGAIKAIGISLLSMVNNVIYQNVGLDFGKVYNTVKNGIVEGAKKYEQNHSYDVHFGFNKAMNILKQTISEISNEYTIVFVVDELDRCLPKYSIKVLERLHHLTENTQNIITVIATDKSQLEHSIKNLFGFDDCSKYLKKFIGIEIKLDYGKISEKITKKNAEYIGLFDKSIVEYNDSIEEFMQAVFQKIDAREQEQIINRATLIHKLLYSDSKDSSFMCIEVLSIVLLTCYNDRKNFTNWFDRFYRIQENAKEWPPFAYYFNNKLNSVPIAEFERFTDKGYERFLQIQDNKSLYGAIAYLWYSLYMKKNNGHGMEIEDRKFREFLDGNVEDLKKFIDAIKLIK